MNPALSVVAFTTLAGAGVGLLGWVAVFVILSGDLASSAGKAAMALGLLLLALGLLASFAHLGRPLRAWRALSQWRSSWLSREATCALVLFPASGALAVLDGGALRAAGGLVVVLAVATTVCTARIYTSLPPIPAWRDRAVLPGFFAFSVLGGAALAWSMAPRGSALAAAAAGTLAVLAPLTAALKLGYWRRIAGEWRVDARHATGLTGYARVRAFEAPHTQSNYLLREMGYVLARRHAQALKLVVLATIGLVPPVLVLCRSLGSEAAWAAAAAFAVLSGTFVERWLFFAEARHLVTLYYGSRPI